MFHFSTRFGGYRPACALIAVLALAACTATAGASEKVLHLFRGGNDGAGPSAGLTPDASGNLYGTTSVGGDPNCVGGNGEGCGVIFQIDKQGNERVLYSFAGGENDGANPHGRLIPDGAGNYYGVTVAGGPNGAGTAFMLAANGSESIVYAFEGGSDGALPIGDLALDDSGNLYGATSYGGDLGLCNNFGCGTVFEVMPDGTETVLHAFQGGADGAVPQGGLIFDSSGNLYGTTAVGGNGAGCGSLGCGTVFKATFDGTTTILHAFQANGSDGTYPSSALLLDGSGALYGTTENGGTCKYTQGCGTVFEIAADGSEKVLYSFQSGHDGDFPVAGVVMDAAGSLYGTTFDGGASGCGRTSGCGTVFKLTPDGKEKVLYAFKWGRGAHPVAGLLLGSNGTLYGTAPSGGKYKDGVVFKVKK